MSCLKKKLLLVVLLLPLLFYPKDSPGQLFKEKVLPGDSPLEAFISLDVKEMDIQNVLRLIAEKGNLNIIFEEEMQGKITLCLKQVKLKEALEAVLEIKRLVFREKDGIIRILKLEEKKDALPTPETRIISLQYIPAEEARELLEHLLSSSGVMKVDKRTNALIVTDLPDNIQRIDRVAKKLDVKVPLPPQPEKKIFKLQYLKVEQVEKKLKELLVEEGELSIDELANSATVIAPPAKIEEVEEYLKEVDVRPKQVMIKAEFVEVSLTAMEELGIKWEWVGSHKGYPLETKVDVSVLSPTAGIVFGKVGEGFSGAINVLLSEGKADLLSSPRITTLDGQEAKIDVVETYPYETVTVIEGVEVPGIEFFDVGTTLLVTPHIKGEKAIRLDINPKVSVVTAPAPFAKAPPITGTRETKTQVMVNSGETIIIGGLLRESERKTKQGVPFLSEIPGLDLLFTYRKTEQIKMDLLVFITPYILPEEKVEKEMIAKLKPRKTEIEEIYQKGKAYQKSKEYGKAKECFLEVIKKSQDYTYLADYLEGAGEKVAEIKKIEKRVEELSREGEALYEEGKYSEAAQRFKAVLRLNPYHQQSLKYITKIEEIEKKTKNQEIEKKTKNQGKILFAVIMGIIIAFAF